MTIVYFLILEKILNGFQHFQLYLL